MADWTQVVEDLREKTRAELREICGQKGIDCTTKTLHEDLVQKIVVKMKEEEAKQQSGADGDPVTGVIATVGTFVVEDNVRSYISVSCGASSGNFLVVGKTVSEVSDFLSEALNIDKLSEPVVNGVQVGPMYVLKSGDALEFVKLAGKKG